MYNINFANQILSYSFGSQINLILSSGGRALVPHSLQFHHSQLGSSSLNYLQRKVKTAQKIWMDRETVE